MCLVEDLLGPVEEAPHPWYFAMANHVYRWVIRSEARYTWGLKATGEFRERGVLMVGVEIRQSGMEQGGPEARAASLEAGPGKPVGHQKGEFEDSRDRVFEVRLEVERVRTEMGEMKMELLDRMNGEFAEVRVEMGEMKSELLDRIHGVEGNLRTEIAEFKKSAGRWLAFGMSFITVLITLVSLLG